MFFRPYDQLPNACNRQETMSTDNSPEYLEELHALLQEFNITSELEWVAVVLFVRNLIRDLSIFTDKRKADLQQEVFAVLSTKDLSAEQYERVVEKIEVFVMHNAATLELETALAEEKRSAAALLGEMNSLINMIRGTQEMQQTSLTKFEDKTVGVIRESEDRSVIVSRVRQMFKELVAEFREETREWESFATELQRTATFDPLLTELYNRRAFDATLISAARTGHDQDPPPTLMMIDVDKFKRVNDEWGHQAGDEVLRTLGRIVNSQAIQYNGFAARYGGEELVVLVHGIDRETANIKAEAIRLDVERHTVPMRREKDAPPTPLSFTVSIGVAQLEPGWGPGDLVRAADKALYRAKENGRNRVVAHWE